MFTETEQYGHRPSPAIVERLLNEALLGGRPVFVAEVDEALVGVSAWVQSPMSSEVLGLGTYVEPDHRKVGLSAKMREAATNYWTAAGATVISGSVDLGNEAGLLSSQRNGFVTAGYIVEKKLND